jgi:hypothetical protein
MENSRTINGITFITNSALSVGDYGGAGSVGQANLQSIKSIINSEQLVLENATYREWNNAGGYYGSNSTDKRITKAHAVELYGGYGSKTIWVREDCDALAECVNALSDYPLIDDEEHSRVEMEWEQEAWDNYVREDLERTLKEDTKEWFHAVTFDDDTLFSCYRAAMDATNTYPVPEYDSVHIDIERISDAYADALLEAVDPRMDCIRCGTNVPYIDSANLCKTCIPIEFPS